MSNTVSILVEYVDGKPKLALSADGSVEKVRSYTRPGDAVNYAADCAKADVRYGKDRDIRVVKVSLPIFTIEGNNLWPEIIPELAVSWA